MKSPNTELRLGTFAMAILLTMFVCLSSPFNAQADKVYSQRIYVRNDTKRTIWVAIRYIPPGGNTYITDGFWRVDPCQRRHVINNGKSRTIYVHVHDNLGVVRGKGAPLTRTVRGRKVTLYPEDTRNDYNPWTLRIYNP